MSNLPMRVVRFLLRHRTAALLLVALTLGVLAAFGARGYISGQLAIERERLAPNQRMVRLVVAKRDLGRGEIVGPETMAVHEMPEAYLPAGTVPPERFESVAGGTLVQSMRAGEPLLGVTVAPPDAAGFSARVRAGIRAMTIAVDEVNAISGMLQPGDRVDLILSARLPASGATPLAPEVARPLMQDLKVLATGRQSRPAAEERQPRTYTTITIEVSPEQAQKLVVAQRVGRLTALLRNPGDRERTPQQLMDVYGLLEVRPTPPATPPPKPAELIVGGVGALRAPDRGAMGGRGEAEVSVRPANPIAMPDRGMPGAPAGAADPSAGATVSGASAFTARPSDRSGSPAATGSLDEAGAHEALLRHLERAAAPHPIPQERTRAQ
ncbi:MAG: hypothetical protein RIS35_865 [Pseudomonadota bacterium]